MCNFCDLCNAIQFIVSLFLRFSLSRSRSFCVFLSLSKLRLCFFYSAFVHAPHWKFAPIIWYGQRVSQFNAIALGISLKVSTQSNPSNFYRNVMSFWFHSIKYMRSFFACVIWLPCALNAEKKQIFCKRVRIGHELEWFWLPSNKFTATNTVEHQQHWRFFRVKFLLHRFHWIALISILPKMKIENVFTESKCFSEIHKFTLIPLAAFRVFFRWFCFCRRFRSECLVRVWMPTGTIRLPSTASLHYSECIGGNNKSKSNEGSNCKNAFAKEY